VSFLGSLAYRLCTMAEDIDAAAVGIDELHL
jgi:hypothetical protein